MTPLIIRTLPIAQLQPAAYNPRKASKPTDPAYRKLKASLEQFGLVEPLVWNERTGRVVGGHLRLRILKDLGITEVPVAVVDLAEPAEKALNVVLNNHEAQGRYDPTKLAEVLTELEELPEFAMTGFDLAALRALTLVPAEELAPLEASDRVEVTLVTDAATFEAMTAELDELIRRYDLVSHVKRLSLASRAY